MYSSFPWRQLAQSWKVDAGYAQSMVIVIAEDVGQCVLGMDSSSAKSISVSSDVIRLRTTESSERSECNSKR